MPILYIVATPIGNLSDFTERALSVLKNTSTWICEDMDSAKRLISIFSFKDKILHRYNSHSENLSSEEAKNLLMKSSHHLTADVALISEAGTPCISDPGYKLIEAAFTVGLTVCPIPGASALTALASVAGFALTDLRFVGFLPKSEKAICEKISRWTRGQYLFFVSPHRLKVTMTVLSEYFPDAVVTMGRELTKRHETIICEPMQLLQSRLAIEAPQGEYAFILNLVEENKETLSPPDLISEILIGVRAGMGIKEIQKTVLPQKPSELSQQQLYRLISIIREDEILNPKPSR